MPKLPNGAIALPVQRSSDGRVLTMLTTPPSELRPYSALCGPRTNSIRSTSASSVLEVFAVNCGTPSI